jgi:hypothetical protein
MDIEQVTDIIDKIADEFEKSVLDCMHQNAYLFSQMVREQLYSGVNGLGEYLSPIYEEDPYFNKVNWHHYEDDVLYIGAEGYKEWKMKITPPEASRMLDLAPRPASVPNLFIDGTFYNCIDYVKTDYGVDVTAMEGDAPLIVAKYGAVILDISEVAVDYFNKNYTTPAIEELFSNSGYS